MSGFRLRHPKPPKLSENDVEAACLDYLRFRQWLPIRIHTGTFKSADGRRWIRGADKGTPDYSVLHERFPGFLLEVKRPGETPSPGQIQKHIELRLGYHLPIAIVESVEQLKAWLAEHQARFPWQEPGHVTSNPES